MASVRFLSQAGSRHQLHCCGRTSVRRPLRAYARRTAAYSNSQSWMRMENIICSGPGLMLPASPSCGTLTSRHSDGAVQFGNKIFSISAHVNDREREDGSSSSYPSSSCSSSTDASLESPSDFIVVSSASESSFEANCIIASDEILRSLPSRANPPLARAQDSRPAVSFRASPL